MQDKHWSLKAFAAICAVFYFLSGQNARADIMIDDFNEPVDRRAFSLPDRSLTINKNLGFNAALNTTVSRSATFSLINTSENFVTHGLNVSIGGDPLFADLRASTFSTRTTAGVTVTYSFSGGANFVSSGVTGFSSTLRLPFEPGRPFTVKVFDTAGSQGSLFGVTNGFPPIPIEPATYGVDFSSLSGVNLSSVDRVSLSVDFFGDSVFVDNVQLTTGSQAVPAPPAAVLAFFALPVIYLRKRMLTGK
ncbi:MAG: hypothetical protein ACRC8S_01180 [Fimbriiglobus sp.]